MKDDNQTYLNLHLGDNQGSTLVELLVAMGLLLAVILPAGAFLGYMANFPKNKEKIIALGEAQTALEQIISMDEYVENKEMVPIRPGWKLEQKTTTRDKKVILQVKVFRRDEIIVELNTVRLSKRETSNE